MRGDAAEEPWAAEGWNIGVEREPNEARFTTVQSPEGTWRNISGGRMKSQPGNRAERENGYPLTAARCEARTNRPCTRGIVCVGSGRVNVRPNARRENSAPLQCDG